MTNMHDGRVYPPHTFLFGGVLKYSIKSKLEWGCGSLFSVRVPSCERYLSCFSSFFEFDQQEFSDLDWNNFWGV